jgi:hypothetical protein
MSRKPRRGTNATGEMGRPRKIILKRPEDMKEVYVDEVLVDPWLPRQKKLAILKELILSEKSTPMEKKACIDAHNVLAGETQETNTFVLRIEVMNEGEIKSALESRITKPISNDLETK